MAYINIDENKRIIAASNEERCGPSTIEITFPAGFTLEEATSWRYDNGEWTYDPLPPSTPPEPMEKTITKLRAQLFFANERAEFLEDVIAELCMLVYGDE